MEYCSMERMQIVCAEFVHMLDPLQILAAAAYLANSVSALPLKHSTDSIDAPAASAASTAIPRSVQIRD